MTGFICLNKHEGITSFSAANRVRRICTAKKAGHTGTLDPMATGVLPVMLGGATKFADFIPSGKKAYEADILLGVSTDTYDITGNELSRVKPEVSQEAFENAVNLFKGDIQQIPPMYSAISQNGVRLYKLARKGVEVEREKRNVTIYSSEIIGQIEPDVYRVSFSCSAGTYIRSLAFDIGEALGCGACLKRLKRTYSNGFDLEASFTLEELEKLAREERINEAVIPVEKVFEIYEKTYVSEPQSKRFTNGGSLSLERIRSIPQGEITRVYSPENLFLGLGIINRESMELEIGKLYIE